MESIQKTEQELQLLSGAEAFLGPLGFRVVDLDFVVAGRSLIRFFVDTKETPVSPGGRVSLEQCAEISRILGAWIEAENLVSGPYDLEVSSPGLDRRLRLLGDFEKAVGKRVKLKLFEKQEGLGANCTGELLSAENGELVLAVDGKEKRLRLASIKRANEVWQG